VKLKSKLDEVAKITSKPLVIVLDSADRLFKEDPAFFSELQRDAKTAADSGSPIYVFVLTKGRGLALWSRAALPFEVRTITGGRLHLLYSFPAPSAKSIKVYCSEMLDATKVNLNIIGLSYTHLFFARLSSSTSIPGSVAIALLEEGQLSKLLEKNILSVRAGGSYEFNSRHVESFFAGECWWFLSFVFLLLSCLLRFCVPLVSFNLSLCRCVQQGARTGAERLTQVWSEG
jgi:hypothetical protein